MEDIFIQKKRGRKPKNKDNNDLINKFNSQSNINDDGTPIFLNTISDDDIIKKKRGRKPTGKIYEINKSLISNMSSGISNCIIAHLPLTEKDIAKIIGKEQDSKHIVTEDQYSDNLSDIIHSDSINIIQKQEKGYIGDINLFKNLKTEMPSHSSFIIEADDDIKHKYNEKCVEIDNLKKKYDDLLEKFKKFTYLEDKITDNGVIEKKYYVANSNIFDLCGNCWRESTDSHCWWCSHSFDTVPVGLPNKYCPKQKKFYLYGCFCSFNCAHSYNLDIKDYKVWERYSLLNYIKKIIYKNVNNTDNLIKPIISAPPKEVLKVYGGELSIEEYRNSSISIPKEYYHLLPPMIPIFSVVEEIPKFFYQNRGSKKKNDFGELKIKRNKPLLTQNNNLLNLIK